MSLISTRLILVISVSLLSLGCGRATVLFSDDFESYAVGSQPSGSWTKSGDGSAIADDRRSVSGRRSIHFRSGEGYRNRSLITFSSPSVFPLNKNRYYGRMFMYVEDASPDGVHWTMLESSGKIPGKNITAEVRYGGQHDKRLMANYETVGARTDCWKHSSLKIPEKRWFKVTWFFDGRKNLMRIWIDGKRVKEIAVNGRGEGCLGNDLNGEWRFPVFENVQIGWVDYQLGGGTRDVWIDDLTISTEAIDR